MKKIVWMLLAVILLLSACGRGQISCPAEEDTTQAVPVEMLADGEETAPEKPEEQMPKEPAEETEEEVPLDPTCGEIPLLGDAPPMLFVVADGETYQFQSGNYSWTSPEQPDGTQMSVIACGIHPLDAEPAEENFILIEPDGTMRFWFYVEPESVTCCCWEERFWGQPEQGEPSAYAVEAEGGCITPISNERYVYELTADWGNGCSASYVFFAMQDAIPSGE